MESVRSASAMRHRCLLTIVIFLSAASLQCFPQIATFFVKTEEVRVDILVTESGKPVKGMGASDFEVRDNGVLQEITFAGFEQIPLSLTLVLDMSSSVAGESLNNLKAAGIGLLEGLKEGDRSALIMFSQSVRLGCPITTDVGRVKMVLDQAQPHSFGRTSLIDAGYAGLILAQSRSDRPLVVLFTDGLDTSSWLTSEAVLDVAKRSDTVVYAVSAGRLPNNKFLKDLTGFTGGSLRVSS
jgi:Ca-activated chloride channel family protein